MTEEKTEQEQTPKRANYAAVIALLIGAGMLTFSVSWPQNGNLAIYNSMAAFIIGYGLARM